MSLSAAVDHVVASLKSAGVHAAADPKNLHRSGVWVTPGTITWDRLDDTTATCTIDLNLLGTPGDAMAALRALDSLLDQVRAVTDIRDIEAVTYPLPGRSLPGYRGQITVEVTE